MFIKTQSIQRQRPKHRSQLSGVCSCGEWGICSATGGMRFSLCTVSCTGGLRYNGSAFKAATNPFVQLFISPSTQLRASSIVFIPSPLLGTVPVLSHFCQKSKASRRYAIHSSASAGFPDPFMQASWCVLGDPHIYRKPNIRQPFVYPCTGIGRLSCHTFCISVLNVLRGSFLPASKM